MNEEFCTRLTPDHNPASIDLVLQPEDLAKITTTMLAYGQMQDSLKIGVVDHVAERLN